MSQLKEHKKGPQISFHLQYLYSLMHRQREKWVFSLTSKPTLANYSFILLYISLEYLCQHLSLPMLLGLKPVDAFSQ